MIVYENINVRVEKYNLVYHLLGISRTQRLILCCSFAAIKGFNIMILWGDTVKDVRVCI